MGFVMKFTCLLMFLCLSSVWPSNAQDQKYVNATAEITAILKTQKEFMVTVATASATDHNGIGGRKMALHKVMRLAKKVKAQGVGGSTNSKKVSTQVEGFVAFNADYHAPRHHPPKNN